MIIAWFLAIPLGVLASLRRGKWLYYGLSVIGMPSLAVPGFVLAGLVLWLLDRMIDPMMSRASLWGICGWRFEGCPMSWAKLGSCLTHLAPICIIVGLPVFTVALRTLRASMLDTLGESYVTVARSKGLSARHVYLKHALKNALNPLISTIGYTLPGVLVNAWLVGFMFGIATYGSLLHVAVVNQDPALLALILVFYSFVLIVGNLLADIGLAMIDPRIRYG
ncbi:ABC transporter permease [Candidatus Bipolaricaulota bacterium]|nr:ABC transporter permease [Candidatus Bipolaricaulota bacterium]